MSNQFYKLKVSVIRKPIKEATSITFDLPDYLYDKFVFYPGQHLIIKFIVNGEEARRSYSLNSSPYSNEKLEVTVKRVKDGLVSNYVNDHLQVNDELEVMIPQGRFTAKIKEDAYKTYFLFAAGSGITPIFSILKSVLTASPFSAVNLFYGNTNQETIIFKEELDELETKYPKRLRVTHTLSAPKVWTSWNTWKGKKGRVTSENVEWFINEFPPIAQHTEYYICGPGKMNVGIRNKLIELGIPKELIHIEQFGGSIDEVNTSINAVENANLTANINGEKKTLIVPKGQTILETLKKAEANPPYSCESGVCGTCTAKIIKGKAEMKSCMALEEKDIANGLILTCQALPTTQEIEVVYSGE